MTIPAPATVQQTISTCLSFLNQSNQESKQIDETALKKVLALDVQVNYLGHLSGEWVKLQGQEVAVQCLQNQFDKRFKLVSTTLSFAEGSAKVTSQYKTDDSSCIETSETYTVVIESSKSVISKVQIQQKKIPLNHGFNGFD